MKTNLIHLVAVLIVATFITSCGTLNTTSSAYIDDVYYNADEAKVDYNTQAVKTAKVATKKKEVNTAKNFQQIQKDYMKNLQKSSGSSQLKYNAAGLSNLNDLENNADDYSAISEESYEYYEDDDFVYGNYKNGENRVYNEKSDTYIYIYHCEYCRHRKNYSYYGYRRCNRFSSYNPFYYNYYRSCYNPFRYNVGFGWGAYSYNTFYNPYYYGAFYSPYYTSYYGGYNSYGGFYSSKGYSKFSKKNNCNTQQYYGKAYNSKTNCAPTRYGRTSSAYRTPSSRRVSSSTRTKIQPTNSGINSRKVNLSKVSKDKTYLGRTSKPSSRISRPSTRLQNRTKSNRSIKTTRKPYPVKVYRKSSTSNKPSYNRRGSTYRKSTPIIRKSTTSSTRLQRSKTYRKPSSSQSYRRKSSSSYSSPSKSSTNRSYSPSSSSSGSSRSSSGGGRSNRSGRP